MQPCSHFGALYLSYTLSSLSYHPSQVKHVPVKCLVQGHNSPTLRGKPDIILKIPAPSSAAGSDIGKGSLSNHCVMSQNRPMHSKGQYTHFTLKSWETYEPTRIVRAWDGKWLSQTWEISPWDIPIYVSLDPHYPRWRILHWFICQSSTNSHKMLQIKIL